MPQSISLEEANGYVNRMRKIIMGFPEVETVVSQHGRPQDGTDATGFFNAEFFVPLKPFSEWPPRVYKEDLTDRINDELQVRFPASPSISRSISRTMSKRPPPASKARTR